MKKERLAVKIQERIDKLFHEIHGYQEEDISDHVVEYACDETPEEDDMPAVYQVGKGFTIS